MLQSGASGLGYKGYKPCYRLNESHSFRLEPSEEDGTGGLVLTFALSPPLIILPLVALECFNRGPSGLGYKGYKPCYRLNESHSFRLEPSEEDGTGGLVLTFALSPPLIILPLVALECFNRGPSGLGYKGHKPSHRLNKSHLFPV